MVAVVLLVSCAIPSELAESGVESTARSHCISDQASSTRLELILLTMADIRDFEPVLPDPKPYIEKALALYDKAARERRGKIVFIAAELGGGKTDLLNALARALHRAKPKPNFVAGFFRNGEYFQQTLDWQDKICLKKTVQAVGEMASLFGLFPGLYSFAASLIGQLFQASTSAYEFGNEFKKHPQQGKETADWLREFLRRTTLEKPLICLLDNWDQATRFYWDEMLLGCSREISQGLPLLLFLTVNEINLAVPDEDESGLTRVIKTLTEKGLAEFWSLKKLSQEAVANLIGLAQPGIASKLHALTGGNARWVTELWREWRLNETVVTNDADQWIWNPRHKPTINLYDDVLRNRLARLLKAETAMAVEDAREILSCGALEGMRFTADAVALALGFDRNDLIDFVDENLVQSDDNPDGLLLEDGSVSIAKPDGSITNLWYYRFVSELHWLALERHGFAETERPDKGSSERLEKTATLVEALKETYAPEDRLVAATLARLLRDLASTEESQEYQRMANYAANRTLMREHALNLLTVNKDDWEEWRCGQTAKFLIDAGRVMLNAFPHEETRMVFEEAVKLAHRAMNEIEEATASSACGFVLMLEGEMESARYRVVNALNFFEQVHDAPGIASARHMLGQIDLKEGQYYDARMHLDECLKINTDLGFQPGVAAALSILAQIDVDEGKYGDARTRALAALKIDQHLGKQEEQAAGLNILSRIERSCLRNHEARIYALKSLEIYKTIGDERGRAMLLINLALIDYSEGRFDDARRQALEALAINQELGTLEGTAYSLDSIARVDYSERRYEDALSRAIQSLRMFNNTDNRKGLGISLYLVGQIAVKLRLLSAAFDLVALAFLVSAEIGFTLELAGGADLITMAARENYSEQQLADIKQRVFEAYQKDKGKELVENALIRLQQVDLSNDPTRQDFSPAPRDS